MKARFSAIWVADTNASVAALLASTPEVRDESRSRYDVHLVWPQLLRGPDPGRQGDHLRSLLRQSEQPAIRGIDRAMRPAAGDPRPFRPYGRCGSAGEPASAGLAVHP